MNYETGPGYPRFGNWGVAHDEVTFIEGYAKYFAESKLGLRCWLNATGAKADRVAAELTFRKLPVYRSSPVPLENLARLLLAADVHLITLRDLVRWLRATIEDPCLYRIGKKNLCSSAAKTPMFTCWRVAHCRPTGIFALTRVMLTDLQTHCMPSSARSYASAKRFGADRPVRHINLALRLAIRLEYRDSGGGRLDGRGG